MYSSLGLLFVVPFLGFNRKGLISFIGLVNGISYHSSRYYKLKISDYLMIIDLLSNIVIAIIMLITEKHNIYYITFSILLVLFNYILNTIRYNSDLLHVLGIQLPVSLALNIYSY